MNKSVPARPQTPGSKRFADQLQHALTGETAIDHVVDGVEPIVVADLTRLAARDDRPVLFVVRDGQRLNTMARMMAFFAPDVRIITFPAWDCLPYDRVSPSTPVVADRMAALTRIAAMTAEPAAQEVQPTLIVTSANALSQRIVPPQRIGDYTFRATRGAVVDVTQLVRWLERNGYLRTSIVREPGDYAVRGGIIDVYPAGVEAPLRLDFFGDEMESVRCFDARTQRTTREMQSAELVALSEIVLNEETIRRFRACYLAAFGVQSQDDPFYHPISEGQRVPGMEHWLGFFYDDLDLITDYIPDDAPVVLDALAHDAIIERHEQITASYKSRMRMNAHVAASRAVPRQGGAYHPAPIDTQYAEPAQIEAALATHPRIHLSPFAQPSSAAHVVDTAARAGRDFTPERQSGANVFEAAIAHIRAAYGTDKRTLVACWSTGTRDRLAQVLADHGLDSLVMADTWARARAVAPGRTALAVCGLERGFEIDDHIVISEQDILGDRLVRPSRGRAKGRDVLADLSVLDIDDLVVHIEHGIGRFCGLRTIDVVGAPHDCLELQYRGGDRLYLPVENIELLSRFGGADGQAQLDRLGGAAWQARKARIRERIQAIAAELIRTAAARALKPASVLTPPQGLYDEFAARFAYAETPDQLHAIEDVLSDIASGRPMDRLVCGDVGFGKTEVALRAAFVTAMAGRQVAVVVPTTLLSRQHTATFTERFSGLPLRIEQASRLVSAKALARAREGIADGTVDIVIGTHALLAKSVRFADLGLLIIDEEQHFGVQHKERLKELKADVHVLTLSATPIPRTLQLAMHGVRDLSLMATPPVDRLAVRTFISPFDALAVREALLRERYRGGQSFFVCPRIADLDEIARFLKETVPEVSFAIAHGQMPGRVLDDIMTAFYDGRYDVLLSTTIVESGLDIPRANTLIVHRAHMFGLAQLYQLRGRVGRARVRAYALFTFVRGRKLTEQAERRLKVLQSLDHLGAGFQLASHDLDIRGAGNLLGEEQSGHIREVGYELYRAMLEEAIAKIRTGEEKLDEDGWSPQITMGMAVLIPDDYVADLQLRMSLYRRLGTLESQRDIDAFAAEMIDRFGALPRQTENLLKIVAIKILCRRAGIDKLDAGPKGIVLSFRHNTPPDADALLRHIETSGGRIRVRPDHRLVIKGNWPDSAARLAASADIASRLAGLAGM